MRISDTQALAALTRSEFSFFLRLAYREVGGEGAYQHNWHLDALIHRLEQARTGDLRRLVVTMPPRHLKSLTISVAWVAWMLGRNPGLRFICVSYGQDLSEKHAYDCLRIMRSDWYRAAFPNVTLPRRGLADFETAAGGGRLSTSLDGVLTGRGAHYIIIDDPMKADAAFSEVARAKAKHWLTNSLMQRLERQDRDRIILVMQRLHADDIAGDLVAQGWPELRLPAIATHDELVPIGAGRNYQRRPGCALHPARQSLATLDEIRRRDSFVFTAQYQQDPTPREGNIVDPGWFGRYLAPPTSGMVVQSWDTAVRTGVRNDWSVGITARYYQGRLYLLDVFRARVTFAELRQALEQRCRRYRVERLLIEDASSGQQLLDLLRHQPVPGVPRPIAVRPEGDKLSRFEAQASRIQAGEVVLPEAAPWLAEFLAEIAAVPNGRHDDQADALAQLLANPPRLAPVFDNAGPEIVYADEWAPPPVPDDSDPWSPL